MTWNLSVCCHSLMQLMSRLQASRGYFGSLLSRVHAAPVAVVISIR